MERLLVYSVLFPVMIVFAYRASKTSKIWENYNVYLAIITYSLIVGLRWNVGEDYISYYNLIMGYVPDYELDRIECIPREAMILIQKLGLPFYYWFVGMALVQIVSLYVAINRIDKTLLPWCTFFFLFLFLDASLNIVRQSTALTIGLCALVFWGESKRCIALALCLLAYGFHHSSVIVLSFFIIAQVKGILSTKWQLILFTVSLFCKSLLPIVFVRVSFLSDYIGYSHIFDSIINNSSLQIEKGSGLGVILNYVSYYFIILCSQRVKQYFETKTNSFALLYNVFFIGICAYSSTMYDMLISRLFMYFTIASVVIFASTIYANIKMNGIAKLFSLLIVSLFVVMQVILASSSDKEWLFIWDVGINV